MVKSGSRAEIPGKRMDRGQARFILQSLRPDGRDDASAEFEEALAEVEEDAALRTWLLDERKRDLAIVAAFEDVPVPPALKAEIMKVVREQVDGSTCGEDAGTPEASIREEKAPAQVGLPAEISAGNEMTVLKVAIPVASGSLAISAGASSGNVSDKTGDGLLRLVLLAGLLVVGAFAAFEFTSGDFEIVADGQQAGSIRDLGQGAVALINQSQPFDLVGNDLYDYQNWLLAGGGPRVDFDSIPQGISTGELTGCRLATIGGVRVSHLCFEVKDTPVHVILIPTMPVREAPRGWRLAADRWTCPETKISVWAERSDDGLWVFLSEHDEQELADLAGRRADR